MSVRLLPIDVPVVLKIVDLLGRNVAFQYATVADKCESWHSRTTIHDGSSEQCQRHKEYLVASCTGRSASEGESARSKKKDHTG